MNKKYKNFIISLTALFFLSELFLNTEVIIKTFFNSIFLWFNNLFPTIFIFFILTDILNNYNFPYYVSKILGNITEKIFKLPKSASYIIIMSLTAGFPGNSKLIKDNLDNNRINEFDATKLLTMTHFSNPLFIIYTVGINILHDIKPINELPFMKLLKKSINNTFTIIFNVLGIIIFFSLITTILNHYLNLNIFSNTILNGLLEITNGLNLLSKLNISKIKMSTIATFFLSFGGISVHMQIMSILEKYRINYFIYLVARIIHASISSLITFLILINC